MRRLTRLSLSPAVFLAIALAGCSASVTVDDPADQAIPQATVEDAIADSLEKEVGQRPDAVDCPGELSAKQGETIRCELQAGADRLGVTATVSSASVKDGKLDFKLDVKVDG